MASNRVASVIRSLRSLSATRRGRRRAGFKRGTDSCCHQACRGFLPFFFLVRFRVPGSDEEDHLARRGIVCLKVIAVDDLKDAADSSAGRMPRRASGPGDGSAPRVLRQAALEGHEPSGYAGIAVDLDSDHVLSDMGDRYPFSREPHAPTQSVVAIVAV